MMAASAPRHWRTCSPATRSRSCCRARCAALWSRAGDEGDRALEPVTGSPIPSLGSGRTMREIARGLFQWSAFHEGIRYDVSSYYFSDGGVVIDPLLPAEGFEGGRDPIEWFADH